MKKCRECNHEVSEQAMTCPHCGAPRPAKPDWDGWGFEYKSKVRLMGIPCSTSRSSTARTAFRFRHGESLPSDSSLSGFSRCHRLA